MATAREQRGLNPDFSDPRDRPRGILVDNIPGTRNAAGDFEPCEPYVDLIPGFVLFPGATPPLRSCADIDLEVSTMGFLDDVLAAGRKVVESIPVIGDIIVTGTQAVSAARSAINGSLGRQTVMPEMSPAMAAAMMAAAGGAATQGSAAQAQFRMACEMDPMCKAAVVAALQGGGDVTPAMMNGSDVSEAQLAGLGLPSALINALKMGGQQGLNALRSLLPGLAIGAGTAVGIEALTGLLPSSMATQKFPRSLFIPDPRGGTREYKYRGRPILYSSDVAALRRVQRVARRAGRARARRRIGVASQIMMLPAGSGRVEVCGTCRTGPCACA